MTLTSWISKQALLEGTIIPVNKPYKWTSFDVVGKIRIMIRKKLHVQKIKVGHAGTLDPLATGLLVICTGKKTKEIELLQDMPKTYTGSLVLGATTPSFDRETEIDASFPVEHITDEAIVKAVELFKGKIQQIPPVFSAIKVNGKRAYEYARNNRELELKAREVEIYSFTVDTAGFPSINFEISCSKGTYIRSLARDFGLALSSGAFLDSLSRTRIGSYHLEDAYSIEELENMLNSYDI